MRDIKVNIEDLRYLMGIKIKVVWNKLRSVILNFKFNVDMQKKIRKKINLSDSKTELEEFLD